LTGRKTLPPIGYTNKHSGTRRRQTNGLIFPSTYEAEAFRLKVLQAVRKVLAFYGTKFFAGFI